MSHYILYYSKHSIIRERENIRKRQKILSRVSLYVVIEKSNLLYEPFSCKLRQNISFAVRCHLPEEICVNIVIGIVQMQQDNINVAKIDI